jgi:hypothetical protein
MSATAFSYVLLKPAYAVTRNNKEIASALSLLHNQSRAVRKRQTRTTAVYSHSKLYSHTATCTASKILSRVRVKQRKRYRVIPVTTKEVNANRRFYLSCDRFALPRALKVSRIVHIRGV